MTQTHRLHAAHALLPDGWAGDVLLAWNDAGDFTSVQTGVPCPASVASAAGPVLPGMPNLHSHAFQRAFGGLTEYRDQAQDSFWSWRTLMYRFAAQITPDLLEAIATWLYAEMLEAGYTSVCEFHYVHHDRDGRPYADRVELSRALLRAAKSTGIGMTLLPVLYQTGGFGGQPASEGQRRFLNDTRDMLDMLSALRPLCVAQGARLGLAPHSLRAVPPEALAAAVSGLHAQDASAPVHIHIAEQTAEVDACLAWSGRRPVQWLLEHLPVDARWCLIHATHMTPDEYRDAARSGAVAGLCPTTEANLGDGIFDLPAWQAAGGTWGLGSDSHATVNAAEELLMLEYSQRLALRQRNVAVSARHPDVATHMMLAAVSGGAQASGRKVAGLAVGQRADFIVLDAEHPALRGLPACAMLSGHVFASHRTSAIDQVVCGGVERIARGRHVLHEQAAAAFAEARATVMRS
ncbi:MAG: formimidoylglutamate deiminase [Bordetella sp.]|uniref:formimidoylglutamate deiminase n=1 Tax=Bordetella sp. TaxID=28081 RepID=UPI003F7C5F28